MPLEDRGKDFEARFAHDETTRFKVVSRRNKLLGLWAAKKLGKSGDEAEQYARSVVAADFTSPGDDDVVEKIRADFEAAGIPAADADIRSQMTVLLPTAEQQIAQAS